MFFALNLMAIFLFPEEILSQASFPTFSDNPEWKIVTRSFWTGGCTISTVRTGSAVVICSNTYFPVYECNYYGDNCVNIGYYSISNNSVYVRTGLNCNEQDKIMYRFNLPVNDTVLCGFNRNDITKFWNTQSANIQYEGVSRLTYTMNYFPYPGIAPPKPIKQMNWIEGVGSTIHPFYSLGCIGSQCEHEQQVIEAYVNGVITYSNNTVSFNNPCAFWVGNIEEKIVEGVSVYPTLAEELVIINNQSKINGTYQLMNGNGFVIIEGKFNSGLNKVDVSELNRGLCFIRVFIDGSYKTVKVNLINH